MSFRRGDNLLALAQSLGWYNVRAYGATGDGVTDDTTSVQAATAAADAAGGGTVFFPAGYNYLLNYIDLTGINNVVFWGYGATVTQVAAVAGGPPYIGLFPVFYNPAASASITNITVKGFTFYGDAAAASPNFQGCVGIYHGTNIIVEDCEAHDFAQHFVYISDSERVWITRNRTFNCAYTPAGMNTIDIVHRNGDTHAFGHIYINENYVEQVATQGIAVVVSEETDARVEITNNMVKDTTSNGIAFEVGSCKTLIMTGNVVEGAGAYGLAVSETNTFLSSETAFEHVVVSNNIVNPGDTLTSGDGIGVAASRAVIANNIVRCYAGFALSVSGRASTNRYAKNVVLSGNEVTKMGTAVGNIIVCSLCQNLSVVGNTVNLAPGASSGRGVYLVNANTAELADNTIVGVGQSGIYLDAGVFDVDIHGNTIYDVNASNTAGHSGVWAASGTRVTIHENIIDDRAQRYALATLTSTNTSPADGDTVTVNDQTYTFRTVLSSGPTVPNEVLLSGVSANDDLRNLARAVNLAGTAGTQYSTGTVAPTGVTAGVVNPTAHTLVFAARTPGAIGNTYPSTEVSGQLSFGAGTFAGGSASASATLTSTNTEPADNDTVTVNNVTYRFKSVMAAANDVKISGVDANTDLANLRAAVNQSGTAGVNYFAGTVAPADVAAGPVDTVAHTLVFYAKTGGTVGNAYPSTTPVGIQLSFGAAVFAGGAASALMTYGLRNSAATEIRAWDNILLGWSSTATNGTFNLLKDQIVAASSAPTALTGLVSGTGKALGVPYTAVVTFIQGSGAGITALDFSTDGGTTYTNLLTQAAAALPAGYSLAVALPGTALVRATFTTTQPTVTMVPA